MRTVLAAVLELAPERIRVRSPHTGGGFGGKGFVWPHQIIAPVAARIVQRPVRIVLTRAQMYSVIAYQPQLVQTVALGPRADGRLTAIDHESINVTSVSDDFVEFATEASRTTYASPAIRLTQRVQRANVNLPNPMRAPVEGCGLWALGSAMNELADRLGIDPLQLRLANYADSHPVTGQPWSSKKLRECYEDGARAFGWRGRPSEPERDGDWLVGQGMADCAMGCFRNPSDANVRLQRRRHRGDRGGLPGHRHRHADDLPPDRRRGARARAGDGQLRDGRHDPAPGGPHVRVVVDDGRRRGGDGRRPRRAGEAARAVRRGARRGARSAGRCRRR